MGKRIKSTTTSLGSNGSDGSDGVNTKETQSSIYYRDTGEKANYPSDFSSDGPGN
jgi:hypothetical protein